MEKDCCGVLEPGVGGCERCHGQVSVHAVGGTVCKIPHGPPLRCDSWISLARIQQGGLDATRGEKCAARYRENPVSFFRSPNFPFQLLLRVVVERKCWMIVILCLDVRGKVEPRGKSDLYLRRMCADNGRKMAPTESQSELLSLVGAEIVKEGQAASEDSGQA